MISLPNLKTIWVVFATLLFIFSCKIDENSLLIPERSRLISKLTTKDEKNFFNAGFILSKNPHIIQKITPRGSEEFIDSLFNDLIRLQLGKPYAEDLISWVGYPIWTHAIVHPQVDSFQTITIPFAGVNDSLTQGILTSVLNNGVWRSYVVSRDTLYSLVGPSVPDDPNIPGYLLGMFSYDFMIFAKVDSVIYNLYNDNSGHLQGSEGHIVLRSCVIVTTTLCYDNPCPGMTLTGNDGEIKPRGDCGEPICENFIHMYGCSGNGTGGGGSYVGEELGGSSGGGGGTGGGDGQFDCNQTPTGIYYLCDYGHDAALYDDDFIDAYNFLIDYLTGSEAQWLLANYETLRGNKIQGYIEFIKNYSSNQVANGWLLQYYITYFDDKRFTHTLNSPASVASILAPYYKAFNHYAENWLQNNLDLLNDSGKEGFLDFLVKIKPRSTEYDMLTWARDFTKSHGYDANSIIFAENVFNLKRKIPAIKTKRCEEVYGILESNPLALVTPCIAPEEEFQPEFWSQLASLTPSTSVISKVNQAGYSTQLIGDADGACVNLDFFFININEMPKKQNGQTMTNEELSAQFRLHINEYSSGGLYGATFSPIQSDQSLWNSNNPLGSIIHIDISIDDGSVVVSDYSSCCWIASTLTQSGLISGDGLHPVSGNRQWGVAENGGNKYFYIKGADRAKNWLQALSGGCNYDASDALWNYAIDNFKNWINNSNQGGNCTAGSPTGQRPSWNSVKEQLISDDLITHINCE